MLAADTTVVLAREIMGKPIDAADATRMLRALAGQQHRVVTGVFLKRGTYLTGNIASTKVWMAPMSDAEIAEYVASGEPMDKAGAYAIQGVASRFIEQIAGSSSNVVGLPIALVYRMLRGFAVTAPAIALPLIHIRGKVNTTVIPGFAPPNERG